MRRNARGRRPPTATAARCSGLRLSSRLRSTWLGRRSRRRRRGRLVAVASTAVSASTATSVVARVVASVVRIVSVVGVGVVVIIVPHHFVVVPYTRKASSPSRGHARFKGGVVDAAIRTQDDRVPSVRAGLVDAGAGAWVFAALTQ